MELFPAIDLQNGCCVRLVKGDFTQATLYEKNPLLQAQRFREAGAAWVHVVDLDGAKDGASRQTGIVTEIARTSGLRVQTGGGIRDAASIEALIESGVERVVIGSLAVKNPDLVKGWMKSFGPERIVLALDVQLAADGKAEVLTNGWQTGGGIDLEDCLGGFESAGVQTVLCTDVGRDGLLGGANVALYRSLIAKWPQIAFLASGGVSDLDDLQTLAKAGCAGAVIGKALYEGKIDLRAALTQQA